MAAATGVRMEIRRAKDHDDLFLVVLGSEGFDLAIGAALTRLLSTEEGRRRDRQRDYSQIRVLNMLGQLACLCLTATEEKITQSYLKLRGDRSSFYIHSNLCVPDVACLMTHPRPK